MASSILNEAAELLEKANANLEPELLTADTARELLAEYARAEKLAAFGVGRSPGGSTIPVRLPELRGPQ